MKNKKQCMGPFSELLSLLLVAIASRLPRKELPEISVEKWQTVTELLMKSKSPSWMVMREKLLSSFCVGNKGQLLEDFQQFVLAITCYQSSSLGDLSSTDLFSYLGDDLEEWYRRMAEVDALCRWCGRIRERMDDCYETVGFPRIRCY